MRSPLGAVNRIAKRLGRIWYSRPRVVSGVPIIGFVMIWTKSAERLVIVWYVALARSRIGQGSGDWGARESPIARSAEWGVRNAELEAINSALRIPHSALVLRPYRRRLRDAPADHLGDHADFAHQLCELVGEQGLRPVRQRLLGVGVHFDHDAVRPCGDCRAGHRDHLLPETRAV